MRLALSCLLSLPSRPPYCSLLPDNTNVRAAAFRATLDDSLAAQAAERLAG